jgi:hypothetical protein
MAQAAADPFDSIENAPDSLASTDDLLSQMAGKEVDRLLADNEPAAAEPPPAPQPPPELPQAQSMTAQLDQLFTELQEDSPAGAPAPEPDPKFESLAQGKERSALLEAAGFEGQAGSSAELEGDSQDPINEAPPQGPERSALLKAAGFEPADASADTAAPPSAATETSPQDSAANISMTPLPFYLKPLHWLNAPLDACPAMVRQLLGMAAIVTLFNAVLVLMYVLIFRKH